MISFILFKFVAILKDIKLYRAIRNVQYGLPHSAYYLFSVLEMYDSKSGTFFPLIDELDFAQHEMFEVSLLSMGELPYEDIVLMTQELQWMKK